MEILIKGLQGCIQGVLTMAHMVSSRSCQEGATSLTATHLSGSGGNDAKPYCAIHGCGNLKEAA